MFSILIYLGAMVILALWMGAPAGLQSNSPILRKTPDRALEDWLKGAGGERIEPQSQGELPKYKFYTEIVEMLLGLARKMGGNYQDSLLCLREGLQADRQFEVKIKDSVGGAWTQMGLMLILTWSFIFFALKMTQAPVPWFKLLLIGAWQGLGLASLPLCLVLLRRHYFEDVGKLWKILHVLRSLARVPLSRSEVMKLAGVGDLKTIRQGSLLGVVEKLRDCCQRALRMGGSYEVEVAHLMDELRFQEKWHFELFDKRLTVIRIGLLCVFFLPSYLAFIFLLLGEVLSLM